MMASTDFFIQTLFTLCAVVWQEGKDMISDNMITLCLLLPLTGVWQNWIMFGHHEQQPSSQLRYRHQTIKYIDIGATDAATWYVTRTQYHYPTNNRQNDNSEPEPEISTWKMFYNKQCYCCCKKFWWTNKHFAVVKSWKLKSRKVLQRRLKYLLTREI